MIQHFSNYIQILIYFFNLFISKWIKIKRSSNVILFIALSLCEHFRIILNGKTGEHIYGCMYDLDVETGINVTTHSI